MSSMTLNEVMAERNLSIQEVAEMSELPYETVRNIYYGKVTDPKVSTLMALSNALGLSVNHLMGDTSYNKEEKELLSLYNKASERGRAVIRLFAKVECDLTEKERQSDTYIVPCLIPIGTVEDGIKYHNCDSIKIEVSDPKVYLAIEITTNYFATAYCKGDRILLENRFPKSGERAVIMKDGIAYFRLYIEEESGIKLRCLNGNGEDIVIKRADEISCIGTCIGVARK